jgi:cytosine/adenosine deaminase-related metal-dependent hydrolase
MGMETQLGSIEVGKRADIVIRSNDHPDAQPNVDVVRQLALVSRTKGVDTVICNGDIIVRHGRLVRLDEDEIYKLARKSAEGTALRAGLKPTGTWPRVT